MTASKTNALLHWQVEPTDVGTRLDVFLAARPEAGLTRSAAARVLRAGAVTVGSRPAKPGLLLRAGDQVAYQPAPPIPAEAPAQDLPLTVLFQDHDLAVVIKPAGMVTHPAPGHSDNTLVNALLHHLDHLSGIGGTMRPGIVHRLDKDTSGLLLVAKNDSAHQRLSADIQARRIQRSYDALVWSRVESDPFDIANRLARDPKDRKRFRVVSTGGREAHTGVSVQKLFRNFSLLRLKLYTGRTHQIRVHCRFRGMPVVGDRTYGKSGEAQLLSRFGLPRPDRQLLHARRLEFIHPLTGKALKFEAPWPEDFAGFVEAVEKQGR